MRVNRFKQCLSKARKFGIKFQVDPCRQPGKTFKQPFDVRVGTSFFGVAINRETPGNFRVFASKFAGHLPKMPQFDVVETEEPFVHGLSLPTSNARSPNPASS